MDGASADAFRLMYSRALLNSSMSPPFRIDKNDNLDHAYDISVDDLIVRKVEQTLQHKVEELCVEWQQMDNQYLTALTERGGITIRWATKGHLAIPKGFSMSGEETQNIDILTHPRIPDAVKEEYLSKLQSLFRRVPRARQLLSKNADTTSLYLKSLKDILDKDSIGSNGKPLQSAPSFAFAEELGAIRSNPHQFQTTSLSAHRSASNTAQVLAGEVVISFTLHSGSQRSQDIDMLGSQTLRDLQDAICHGLKEKYVNEVESNTKSRSDCFFFIEGYFYADDVSPPSQQPHTSWRADSAERLHKIRRWLLHGNQDATASSQNAALVGEECSVEGEVFEEVEVEEEEEDIMEGTVETSLASNQRLKLAAVKDRHKKFAAAPAAAAPVAPAPAAPGSRRRKTSRHDPSPVVGKAKINQNTISSKGVKRKTPVTSTARKGPITKKASSVSFIDPNSDSDGSSSDYEKHGSNSDAQIGQKTTIQRGLVKRSIGPTSAGGSASSSSALNSQPLTLGPYNRALRNCTGNVMNSGSSASDSNSNSRSDIRESRLELNGLSASSALTILSLDTTIGSLLLRSGVRYLYNHSGSTSGDREYFLYVTDMHLHSSIRGSTNKSDGAKDKPVFHRDLPLISSYPRQTFQVRTVVKKCAICLLWSAQYVVYGDRLADRSPMLYCQHCYFMMHYSPSGEIIYDDFTVHPCNQEDPG